jgi:hypothetical protein
MLEGHVVRIARIQQACTTMAELHEETRLLYEPITAEARRARAAARTLKHHKKAVPRHR